MVGPTCRGPSTPCPPTSIDAGVNCVKDQWSEVPAEAVPRSVDGVTRKRHCLDIYIYTHIHLCVYYLYALYIYICVCVCVFLNPFEPNKQTYLKLHKLGQNHGWDQDRPRTPPGALGLSCGPRLCSGSPSLPALSACCRPGNLEVHFLWTAMGHGYMEVSINFWVPPNRWFEMENPIKMDDLGVPLY